MSGHTLGSGTETAVYGVPDDLDLSHMVGARVARVDLTTHCALIVLEPEGSIQIEGQAELHLPQGRLLAAGRPNQGESLRALQQLAGAAISDATVEAPSSVSFRFTSGQFVVGCPRGRK